MKNNDKIYISNVINEEGKESNLLTIVGLTKTQSTIMTDEDLKELKEKIEWHFENKDRKPIPIEKILGKK